MVASARRPFTRSLTEAEEATSATLSAPLGGCWRGPTGGGGDGGGGGGGGGGASRGRGGGGGGSPCSPMPSPPPGYDVLANAYQLGRTLWRGTNSHVLEAVRRADGVPVAVKAVAKACLSGRGRAALAREVLTLKRLTQLGGGVAVSLLEVVEDAERVFLVTELLQGGTLLQWALGGGERGVPLLLEVARQLLAALAECHSMGVCHNDVKLENVMLAAPVGEEHASAAAVLGSRSHLSPADAEVRPEPPPVGATVVDGAMAPADALVPDASACREPVNLADVADISAEAAAPYRDVVDVRLIDFGLCFWRRRPRATPHTPVAAGRCDDSSSNGVAAITVEAIPSGLQTPPTGPRAAPSLVQSAARGCGDRGTAAPAGERGACGAPADVVGEYAHAPSAGEASPVLSAPSTPMPDAPRSSRTSGVRLHNPVGTAAYAAPELVMRQPYDPRSADVWAAGVVVYALVAHRLPFGSPVTPGGMTALGRRITTEEPTFTGREWAAVPAGLVSLLRRMLCKDPDRRLSMRAALDTLDAVIRAMPPGGHAASSTSGCDGEDGNGLTRALAAAEDLARSVGAGTAALVAAFMAATCRLGPLYTAPTTPGRPCPPRRCLTRSVSLRSLSPDLGSTQGAARGVRRKREEGDGRPVPVADGSPAGQRALSRRRADLRGASDSGDGSTDGVP